MRKIILVCVLLAVSYLNTGCKGMVAGIVNTTFINKPSEDWVNGKLKKVSPLNLNEEQKAQAEKIYLDEITALKENARKAKTGEIKNKASIYTIEYETWKSQILFEKILDKEQLIAYRQGVLNKKMDGIHEKALKKVGKKLKKKGFNTNL